MDDGNSTTTKLLTLLNVSATKLGKHKWDVYEEVKRPEKLNKRKTVKVAVVEGEQSESDAQDVEMLGIEESAEQNASYDDEKDGVEDASEPYESHFGCTPSCLSTSSRSSVDAKSWKVSKSSRGKLGQTSEFSPEGLEPSTSKKGANAISERLRKPFSVRQAKASKDQAELQNDILSAVTGYQDFYSTYSPWEAKKCVREAISLHVLNHITKHVLQFSIPLHRELTMLKKASEGPQEQ
ncbi:rRNA-binding ribosome biosynthesis protein utp25 [Marasmius tenuissimus]|nr:rRNA-binding ribosome biosynthesis protein utp25 [Marasmius tenuissimus]